MEDDFVKDFENINKGIDGKIDWDVLILKHVVYVGQWCILLWTKLFELLFTRQSAFTNSNVMDRASGGGGVVC